MVDLLTDCAIFLPIQGSVGNYYQLSGVPVSEVRPAGLVESGPEKALTDAKETTKSMYLKSENRTPGAITFVRSRMLYAKAALNAKGGVRFGMRHIRAFSIMICRIAAPDMACRRLEPFP